MAPAFREMWIKEMMYGLDGESVEKEEWFSDTGNGRWRELKVEIRSSLPRAEFDNESGERFVSRGERVVSLVGCGWSHRCRMEDMFIANVR